VDIGMSKVQCLECGEILESKHRHDFHQCSCQNQTFVDGGSDYIRCGGVDLSKVYVIANDKDCNMKKSIAGLMIGIGLLVGGCVAAVDPYGNVSVTPAPVTITTPPVYVQPAPPVYVTPPSYRYRRCYTHRQRQYDRYGNWYGYRTYRRCD
jgi:hypothetical protein